MRTGNIGGIQGGRRPERVGALSPLLSIVVLELVSRTASTRDILLELPYSDDLAVVADSEAGLRERLVYWNGILD